MPCMHLDYGSVKCTPQNQGHCLSRLPQHWPQSAITTGCDVLPSLEPTASTFFTTSMPSVTLPKTTCLPSKCGVWPVQMKNWLPLVLGPALAMERHPLPVCLPALPEKLSSANLPP